MSFNKDFGPQGGKWLNVLNSMRGSITHRGKADTQTVLNSKVCLSMNSKKDKGPIEFYIEGKHYYVMLDGYIFNINDLKPSLKHNKLKTGSPLELILFLFLEHGIEFIHKLNGIFSIALYDGNNFYLIRDRLGNKPIFYTVKGEILIFGSEIKSILKFPGVECILDKSCLSEIFALGPAHIQGSGVFKDIKEVTPGSYLHFEENTFSLKQYWAIKPLPHTDSYEDTVAKTRKLILNSIESQTEKNTASLLSGGVDSSIITAIANKTHKEKFGTAIQTFSFDFKGNSKYFTPSQFQPGQDRPWVEKLVAALKTDHTYLEADVNDLIDNLFKAVDARDCPGMADVDSSLLYFCSKMANTNTALSGECADEIFGGYPWFHKKEMFEAECFPWSSNMGLRKSILNESLLSVLDIEGFADKTYKDALKSTPVLESENAVDKRRRELAYLNLKFFMMALVDRMDRMGMYSGLELRAPYSDYRIAEYVFNIPWGIKFKDKTVKHLLRKSCEGVIPNEMLYRIKSPYPKTYNPAYDSLLKERLNDVINDNNQPLTPLINKVEINKLINSPSDTGKPYYGQLMAKPQLLAYLLQVNYWLANYKIIIKI
ncbi:MAG: asparagine synthase (glutamine-hydrolyzing) [Clostridiales bacterium]|nr:asparagine synthase (glutamine-hydrolyzing) [Clostridiales bacterium]